MTKKKKSQFQRPDETFSSGPITVSRFGLNTVLQSNWQENDFEKFQENLVDLYPKIIVEIDNLVLDA